MLHPVLMPSDWELTLSSIRTKDRCMAACRSNSLAVAFEPAAGRAPSWTRTDRLSGCADCSAVSENFPPLCSSSADCSSMSFPCLSTVASSSAGFL